ncbi:tRNA (5-methylaminomethyl-2-thiouridine)(34)-methyltransferase MnmD [Roseibium aggregatum]|uniref:tRNA (5-methylaminomethyl-2-thiouridine)(34)-methyltransferase MnmD n=1 Tax=Roseibium aggregatum TaxID=187304 RepID=A0A926NWJ7_9HYPH|nr:tRNA (5-methylaminomethyl-2-thiouridine)(34)-methyltransferase MnmD [Roseibium aggregatum]MBD1545118.1 tRNA (5-methylaminomethyl-2-thiouridine)(34)-methyltransferase MnmD [Roseibium aggregatum]
MGEPTQKKTPGQIVAPSLDWLDGEVPRAEAFDDTYFSRAGGLEETRHVFLAGNGLPDRWQGRESFTIAEFGFGTGLNFLTTLKALKAQQPPPHLTFISFELYPMTREQLARALGVFPDLADEADELTAQWQPAPGWSKLTFDGADLWLGIGDARDMIADLARAGEGTPSGPVDAWYFDGFSPARNPELWEEDLLKAAFDVTAEDGTFATYTAAGWVRRNLAGAGFIVEKQKGFAGKREMVAGRKD